MGKLFGGRKSTEKTENSVNVPGYLQKPLEDVIKRMELISKRPFQRYSTDDRIADFSDDELNAFQGIRDTVGNTSESFNKASESVGSILEQILGGISSEDIRSRVNPFDQNVIDIERRKAIEEGDRQREQVRDLAARTGSFGGSRAGIIESQLNKNLQERLGDIQSVGQRDSFNNALNQYFKEKGLGLSSAGALSQLAGAEQRGNLLDLSSLENIGRTQRVSEQLGKDFDFSEFLREDSDDTIKSQQLFNSLAAIIPSVSGSTSTHTKTAPRRGWLKDAASLVSFGASLYGAGSGAGGAGGAGGTGGYTFGFKDGGLVRSSTEEDSFKYPRDQRLFYPNAVPITKNTENESFLKSLFNPSDMLESIFGVDVKGYNDPDQTETQPPSETQSPTEAQTPVQFDTVPLKRPNREENSAPVKIPNKIPQEQEEQVFRESIAEIGEEKGFFEKFGEGVSSFVDRMTDDEYNETLLRFSLNLATAEGDNILHELAIAAQKTYEDLERNAAAKSQGRFEREKFDLEKRKVDLQEEKNKSDYESKKKDIAQKINKLEHDTKQKLIDNSNQIVQSYISSGLKNDDQLSKENLNQLFLDSLEREHEAYMLFKDFDNFTPPQSSSITLSQEDIEERIKKHR